MSATKPLTLFHRLRGRAWHVWFRFSRPMTLGVQAIVLDGENRVFLVRHSYVPGWHFPGGGVEAGETVLEALARELREEGNIVLEMPPKLHGVFFNNLYSRRDHVIVYIAEAFHQTAPRQADIEIVETGFFPLNQLPPHTTRAARARLEELFGQAAISPTW